MKAKDLMIGNLVHHLSGTESGVRSIIEHSTGYALGLYDMKLAYDLFEFTPIPLTEEWLRKFGFTKLSSLILDSYRLSIATNPNSYKEISITLQTGNQYLMIREGALPDNRENDDIITLWNRDIIDCFYVHKLQNLYFTLTGKELELKMSLVDQAKKLLK